MRVRRDLRALDQYVPAPLVVPLEPIVLHEFMHRPSQVRLAQWNDPVQTLASDREHEPLRVHVQVRTTRRQPQLLHPAPFHRRPELARVYSGGGSDQVPLIRQNSIARNFGRLVVMRGVAPTDEIAADHMQCGSGGAGGSTGVAGASGEAGSGGDGERRTGGDRNKREQGAPQGALVAADRAEPGASTGGASGAGTDGATASGGSPGTAEARAAEPAPGPPRCAATGDAALSPPLGNHSGSSGCRCAVGPTSAVDLIAMAVIRWRCFLLISCSS